MLYKSNINNKTAAGKAKSHGQRLSEIAHELKECMVREPLSHLVREEALHVVVGPQAKSIPALHKVVGVSDLVAWNLRGQVFDEISPKTVKKLVTGDGEATKDTVAKSLEQYVGPMKYECDDESDAVAVGIAWLIQHGYLEEAK